MDCPKFGKQKKIAFLDQVELWETKMRQNTIEYNSLETSDVSQQLMELSKKPYEIDSGSDPENNKLLFSSHPIKKWHDSI